MRLLGRAFAAALIFARLSADIFLPFIGGTKLVRLVSHPFLTASERFMGKTSIEWTSTILPDGTVRPGYTFNPWVGCTKISPGCDHCYAESWAKRTGSPQLWGDGDRRRTTAQNWRQPIKWNAAAEANGTRARVFCASLADVFDNTVPEEWRRDLFELISQTTHLDWLLLTKRIGKASEMIMEALRAMRIERALWPWDNVWLGATVVNQEEADRDIPKLLATPARIRFLSMEPLLGPVDFAGRWVEHKDPRMHETTLEALDWVIVGGESGGGARQIETQWIEDIQAQCRAVNVPIFIKQLGRFPIANSVEFLAMRDSKGGDMAEWPVRMRVREFPA